MSSVTEVAGVPLTFSGRLLKVARVWHEWDVSVDDPEAVIKGLRSSKREASIFCFMQRLPHSHPKYPYHRIWDNVAGLRITDYDTWLFKQIHRNSRNKLKKAEKAGITIRRLESNDELYHGIKEIQDESPIRQGKKFKHYGKDIETVRKGHSTYSERATILGAYLGSEFVGYLKIVPTTGFARVMGLLSKRRYDDKAPMNALLAAAVQVCVEKQYPWLVYARYSYGTFQSDTIMEFKANNGFEHVLLPRYFAPLNLLGQMAIKSGYIHGYSRFTPRPIVRAWRDARARYTDWKYRDLLAQSAPASESKATPEPAREMASS